jgi:hypothetical protein
MGIARSYVRGPSRSKAATHSVYAGQPHVGPVVDDVTGDDQAQLGDVDDAGVPGVGGPTGSTDTVAPPSAP